ncbi:metallophosphoesterase family protein [Zhouia sp. PK063]|uniref:metallophosphoesterase family protein n=1 Tax=Zhouia sp. PK063 TaxID=3373602 RepID=UPI0037A732EE
MGQRTLVIGDIHGANKALQQVLERAAVTINDKLIFLGDYVDGWSETPEVIDTLIQLKASHNCVFIQGNHDELCLEWLNTQDDNEQWLFHGGKATVDAYQNVSPEKVTIHKEFLEHLELYHIDENNRLFLHAGFTNQHGVTREYFSKMFYWDRTLWEMAIALDASIPKDSPMYPKRLQHYKEIFIGHTPTMRIGKSTPVNAANVWNVDTGAAYVNPLTIMDVETKEFWQSDPVNILYPNENGRN